MKKNEQQILDPVINCHTHIFTEKHVPPKLGRKILPFPLGELNLRWAFKLYNTYKNKYQFRLIQFNQWVHHIQTWFNAKPLMNYLLSFVKFFLTIFFGLNGLYIFLGLFFNCHFDLVCRTVSILIENKIILVGTGFIHKGVLFLLALYFAPSLRKLVVQGFRNIIPLLPSEETISFLTRYKAIMNLIRYKNQKKCFDVLYKQYPPGSKMVVLTMDMDFLGAGTCDENYIKQLEELNGILSGDYQQKNAENLIAFLHTDARRMSDPSFFKYKDCNGVVTLEDCKLKYFLEKSGNDTGNFKGIKIYPATGYYPFDEALLPLWLYCVQNNIPVTTHCSVGPIFYRKTINKKNLGVRSIYEHPIFLQGKDEEKLRLYGKSNFEYQKNFTHPMNYLVLLNHDLLATYIACCDKKIKELFGYSYDENTKNENKVKHKLQRDLRELKINLAHFGSKEQMIKYLSKDRDTGEQKIMQNPLKGIDFARDPKPGEKTYYFQKGLKGYWDDTDWYSIITSMMLQYSNVYSDISYTLHDDEIHPLINFTLDHPVLSKRVIFGTDYHVVSNHASEKALLMNIKSSLSAEKYKAITQGNAKRFLNLPAIWPNEVQ